MLNLSKKNNAVFILYSSRNYSSGVTVTARVYNDANSEISGSPFTLSEIGSTGLYGTTFTPTTNGNFKMVVYEGTSKLSSASIKITDYDIESVGGDVTSVLTLLQNATYGLDALHTHLTNMEGSGFVSANDSLKAIKDYLVNTIQTSITAISGGSKIDISLSTQMIVPASSSTPFKFYATIMNSKGQMEDPTDQDSGSGTAMVSVHVEDENGNSRDSNLSGMDASTFGGLKWMTRTSTGRFSGIYNVSSAHEIEPLNFVFSFISASTGYTQTVNRASLVIEEADISSQVNTIESVVVNATYGLSALKVLIDAYQVANQADLTNIENKIDVIDTNVDTANASLVSAHSKIDIIDTNVDSVVAYLASAVYGLNALKTLINTLQTTTNNLQASVDAYFADVKGAGFNTSTDSLKQIKDKLNAVFLKTGGYIA